MNATQDEAILIIQHQKYVVAMSLDLPTVYLIAPPEGAESAQVFDTSDQAASSADPKDSGAHLRVIGGIKAARELAKQHWSKTVDNLDTILMAAEYAIGMGNQSDIARAYIEGARSSTSQDGEEQVQYHCMGHPAQHLLTLSTEEQAREWFETYKDSGHDIWVDVSVTRRKRFLG